MFIHLNVHSCYSLLSGTARPEALAARARWMGQRSLAITDSNGLYAAVAFQKACEAEGIHSILGAELTRAELREQGGSVSAGGFSRERPAGPSRSGDRATLLVRSETGYGILGEILSSRQLDDDFRFEHALTRALRSGELFVLVDEAALLTKLAPHDPGGRLIAELRPGPEAPRRKLIKQAWKLGVDYTASGGVFFEHPQDHELHRLLCAMRLSCAAEDLPEDAVAPHDAWLMDEDTIRRRLGAIPREAFTNTEVIARGCQYRIPTGRPRPPLFQPLGSEDPGDPERFLFHQAHLGLWERTGFTPKNRKPEAQGAIVALRRELDVIRRRGVSAYFLIAWDLVRHGRTRGLESLGRGSAASSLVSYALQITHVNPLEHGLYFERFLNMERKGLPDFDIDFGSEARYEILDFIYERYGRDRVALIGCWHQFRPRSAFRGLMDALGIDVSPHESFIKTLPRWGSMDNLRDTLRKDPRMRAFDLDAEPYPKLFELAAKLEGVPRHMGTHPCGVVIAPGPIRHFVPLQPSAQGYAITQWDMYSVEDAGLVKMDILGQRGLAVIDETQKRVRENFGLAPRLSGDPGKRSPDPRAVNPFADKKTRSMLSEGRTEGCFYIESPIMMQLLRQAHCEDFETLTALSSIIRPGVSNHGGKSLYLRRHLGLEPVRHEHALLEPVLRDSKGCLIYQEQVIRVLREIGGLSLGEADHFRKLMTGKERHLDLEEFSERFLDGARTLFLDAGESEKSAEKIATSLLEKITGFAGYAFCKAHSASFARESFESTYWKAHFPAEFMASVIEERGGYYSTAEYVEEARRLGLSILPPHVNAGTSRTGGWSGGALAEDPAGGVESGGHLRIGLSFLKGVREIAVHWMAEESARCPFYSLEEFVARAHGDMDGPRRWEVALLLRIGGFDGLPVESLGEPASRIELLSELRDLWPTNSKARAEEDAFRPLSADIGKVANRAREELAVLGFSPSLHPLLLFNATGPRMSAADLRERALEFREAESAKLGPVRLAGVKVTGKRTRAKSDGRIMAFYTFSDETGTFEAVFFPRDYARLATQLRGAGPFWIEGEATVELGEPIVEARNVKPFDVGERMHIQEPKAQGLMRGVEGV
jgi:error-prone DNA polymerase